MKIGLAQFLFRWWVFIFIKERDTDDPEISARKKRRTSNWCLKFTIYNKPTKSNLYGMFNRI